ncbi:MAG: uroporphyrinogen decarboxylase family protein [Armatimonadota bacterium]|nr:uroporphyrinogen decarboxylase family protein [Armatimonadota bacterium]
MNLRAKFLNHVKSGGPPVCSPQIGAGAGFDTKLAGKDNVHETTLEDTLAAVGKFDIVPLINAGLCDLSACNPALAWKLVSHEIDGEGRTHTTVALPTPAGELTTRSISDKRGGCRIKAPIETPDELDALEYYIDTALDGDFSAATRSTEHIVGLVGDRGAVSIQWAVQPYELLCFPSTVDTALIAHDCPDRAKSLMDKILLLDDKLFEAVAKGGADFIFLGGPGAEMISPRYYQEFIVPYSREATAMAHSRGLLVYSHICSPIEPFLTMGYYNQMGIDLFETLSPPPVGNVASLKDAMDKLDPAICTRGNLGLDVLLNASPEDVREKTFEIIEATAGRKHMVGASDYLFFEVPEENVQAMAAAVKEYNK